MLGPNAMMAGSSTAGTATGMNATCVMASTGNRATELGWGLTAASRRQKQGLSGSDWGAAFMLGIYIV